MSTTVYSPFVNELKEKTEFEGTYLVKIIQLHLDKNGRPYANLILMDKTGEIEARAWDGADKLAESVRSQDIVRIAGRVNLYQGRRQVVVEAAAKVADGTMPMDRFLPSSAYDLNRLYADLTGIFQSVEDAFLRKLALDTLGDTDVKRRVMRAPAAKSVHHAYVGGLLEHTLSVCRVLDGLAKHYRNYYGKAISRDHMLIGGLFHDIGKIYELSFEKGTEYTKEGQLVGHHVLGCELVDRIAANIPGFPADLKIEVKHLILAHHGKLEYGSPKVPHTVEALLVHYIDDLDSKINTIMEFVAEDTGSGEFTAMNKLFERPFLRTKAKPEFKGSSPGLES